VPPIVKSGRDGGDTPYRQNHQEEAKLCLLHTSSLHRTSPLHTKQRNQEGPQPTSRWQCPDILGRRADHKVR
jgi:hypothetical protein